MNKPSIDGEKTTAENTLDRHQVEEKQSHPQDNSHLTHLLEQGNTFPLFYQQFSGRLFAVAVCVLLAFVFAALLYFQNKQYTQAVINADLRPLQQQVKELQQLQQTKQLVEQLLQTDEQKNWLELHKKLVKLNQQLLSLNTQNAVQFKQWLNENESAQELIERVQKNQSRNQQLKQSSIIQLQLALFSARNLVAKQVDTEQALYQQIEKDKINDNVRQSRLQAYANISTKIYQLKQLNILLSEALMRFKSLSITTLLTDFDLLRAGVEQAFTQAAFLASDKTKAVTELRQQLDSFKAIALTEQNALGKWQGYLRLIKDYNLALKNQNQQIGALISTPLQQQKRAQENVLTQLLARYSIPLDEEQMPLVFMVAVALFLLLFCYYLWSIRQKIKQESKQNMQAIKLLFDEDNLHAPDINSYESFEVIKTISQLTKPKYSEQAYQVLEEQYQSSLNLIAEQKQDLAQLTQNVEELEIAKKQQAQKQINHELHRYRYLKNAVLSHLLAQPANQNLSVIYEVLNQFELVSNIQSNETVLALEDINLIEALNTVLFNKQSLLAKQKHQLYMSYDQQIISDIKLDVELFEHIFNALLNLLMNEHDESISIHLHAQLADKNAGQQLIRFFINVSVKNLKALPAFTALFSQDSEINDSNIALVKTFKLLLDYIYGRNINAQLLDEGYQISFEIPFAIASNNLATELISNIALAETKILLLSSNAVLTKIIPTHLLAYAGKAEVVTRLDSLTHLITPEYLSQYKLDLLIVDSDMAKQSLSLIEEHFAQLPLSLKPKLMVLQSEALSYYEVGFYSQAEQPLCQHSFINNIVELLNGGQASNLLWSLETFNKHQYSMARATVLLAVQNVQSYQTMHRLLLQLGCKVVVVCCENSQQKHWQTGRYNLLLTEFTEKVFIEMKVEPIAPVGVFSLSTPILASEKNKKIFNHWHIGELSVDSAYTQLVDCFSPWLKVDNNISATQTLTNVDLISNEQGNKAVTESEVDYDELLTNALPICLAPESDAQASFDFNRYLQHQASVASAMFMLDEYTQDNRQQLANLAMAIKDKSLSQAQEAAQQIYLNARILSSQGLQECCQQWLAFLTDEKSLADLKTVNKLLKATQQVLHDIDSYAKAI